MKALLLAMALMFAGCIPAYAADPCLGCHEKQTPLAVAVWKGSAHFKANVTCVGCHDADERASHEGRATVGAARCGACHEKQVTSQGLGKHSMGLKSGGGCTRAMPKTDQRERSCKLCHKAGSSAPFIETACAMFLAQSPQMQRQGCSTCHRVETGCDACHTKHSTDTKLAAEPRTCGMCHMGPDHPQYEAWASSVHGVLYEARSSIASPTCATCHMERGSHNVSEGIATGREDAPRERGVMLRRCAACHAETFARRSLDDADAIAAQGRALVEEAHDIVAALGAEGLLSPSPKDRTTHPLEGHALVLGPQMTYDDLSGAEAMYFRLSRFYYATMFKSAFHQSPDYAHWYGNAMLKLELSTLKSEAAALRQTARLGLRIDNLAAGREASGGVRDELRALRDRFLRGELSETQYKKAMSELLDKKGY